MEDDGIQIISPKWTELPPLAVENVYSFLNRQEQRSMSSVCRKWHAEYESPRLWRRMVFQLPESAFPAEACPEVLLARKYGHMLFHVEVTCKRIRPDMIDMLQDQFIQFLAAVADQSQLQTLAFTKMNRFFRHLPDGSFLDVYQAMENVFRKQDNLQSVDFREGYFQKSEAAGLLKLICTKKKINRLLLKSFASETFHDEARDSIFGDELESFDLKSLIELEMDYTQLFENIVNLLHARRSQENQFPSRCLQKGCLERITLFCDGTKRINYAGIPSSVWLFFRKLCPDLQINLQFQAGITVRNPVNLFIVRHMPIKSLDFRLDQHTTGPFMEDFGSLLRFLVSRDIHHLLEELTIVWLRAEVNLANDLMAFLQVSPNLKTLQLHASYPTGDLDAVFNSWLENRRSLENAHITVENVANGEEIENYLNLSDEYGPLLQVVGLNLILIANQSWRPMPIE